MAKKRKLSIRTPRRAMEEVKPAAEPELDEEELEKAMAEAEQDFFKQQAEEHRKLRELAQPPERIGSCIMPRAPRTKPVQR